MRSGQSGARPGAFGEKSVLLAPGYRPPAWLEQPAIAGARDTVEIRVLGRELSIDIWSPTEGKLPLLVAHDGPEYDELAALTRYAGAMIEADVIEPFRVALLPPGDRDEWYSASAAYGRALCNRILPAIRDAGCRIRRSRGHGREPRRPCDAPGAAGLARGVRRPVPAVGELLRAPLRPPRVGVSALRQDRAVRPPRAARGDVREPVPVSMTCGAEEENVYNNRLMASALAAQGYDAHLAEVPDLHNYTGWRDAFDPYLTRLLADLWTGR